MPADTSKPSDLPHYLQEDEVLTQECKHLIAALPCESEPGWFTTRLHCFHDFWIPTHIVQGVLNCHHHFHACDSDILLVTSPKCGTTWLKALAFAALYRKTHHPTPSPHPLLTANPHALVPSLEFSLYLQDPNPDLASLPLPRLFGSHIPYMLLPESARQSACKIVYLCRDPKDTFISMWHFANRVRPGNQGVNSLDELFDKFCQGVSMFGPFWEHVLGYYKESLERPEKIMVVRFEDMKAQPGRVLKDLAEFMGCGFSQEEENNGVVDDILRLCSFENLSNLEVNKNGKLSSSGVENKIFFRRGEVGDSENFLTSEMIERLNAITEEKFGKHGLVL